MNTSSPSKLIAVTGGSGAGKTWLVHRLLQEFGEEAAALSLDNFYRDLSHLRMSQRELVNFDDPNAIDWPLFEDVLHGLRHGTEVSVPRYDFVSHTRWNNGDSCRPRAFIFVEGLWPLWRAWLRQLFHLGIFLNCPESLRWQRRAERDLKERGRTPDSIREQFYKVVAPMHGQFVEVQKPWADVVLEQPLNQADLDRLVVTIRALRIEPGSIASKTLSSDNYNRLTTHQTI